MKLISIIFAMVFCLPVYAQLSCVNYPYDEGINIQDAQGGVRILATGQASVEMDDVGSIKDAREEATLEAKAIIAKFLTEEIRSTSQIDKLANESKQVDGKSAQINRAEMITRLKSLRNSAQALLRGVVPLGSCYTKGREVRVTVGLMPETIRAAEGVAGEIDPIKLERNRPAAELAQLHKKRQDSEERLGASQTIKTQDYRPVTNVTSERRVALLIGNAAYQINPLKNPVNDANDMARLLKSVGFDVIEVNNATLLQMREATRNFGDKLSNSDVGLVYYSGHGVEVKSKNYLIPVNADIKREYEVADQAFDASQFLEMMDNIRGPNNKRVNILIVDACRNNELQRSWRSTNNGLARMDAPGGTFISFATAPGRVAADGVGRNSPYTKHLLQALKQPNMPIEQVFKVVRRNVMDETKGEQIPWENSSLVGDFFFTVQK